MLFKCLSVLIFCVFFLASTMVSFAQTLTHGTAIVLLRDKERIIVATDSKTISGTRAETKNCKIIKHGSVFFAAAGLYTDSKTFDVFEFAKQACAIDGTISDKAMKFKALLRDPLLACLNEQVRLGYGQGIIQRFAKASVSQAVFFGFEGGKPVFHAVAFNIIFDKGVPVDLRTTRNYCPGGECEETQGRIWIALGASQHIVDLLKVRPDILKAYTPEAAKDLIVVEIKGDPDNVGLPIAILQIDKTRARWIQRGECEYNAQQKPSKPAKKRVRGKARGK